METVNIYYFEQKDGTRFRINTNQRDELLNQVHLNPSCVLESEITNFVRSPFHNGVLICEKKYVVKHE